MSRDPRDQAFFQSYNGNMKFVTLDLILSQKFRCFKDATDLHTLKIILSLNLNSHFQKTILDSISTDDPTFKGDGYTSLAIIYAVLAICNWLSPSALSIVGPRAAMLIGSITYW